MKSCFFCFVFLFAFCLSLPAQTYIVLENPSFEANFGIGTEPDAWMSCVFENETPVDIHPNSRTYFNVQQKAFHGDNFLSMVVRERDTWESLGARLVQPLQAGKMHYFQLAASKARSFESFLRDSPDKVLFSASVRLRLWGGKDECSFDELLAVSAPIDHNDWKLYSFAFRPAESYDYFYLEAYFADDQYPENGNVLIDGLLPIAVHEDTVRYQAVCLEEYFLEFIDTKTITPEQLEQLLINYTARAMQLQAGVISKEAYTISVLNRMQEKLTGNGLRQYILQVPDRLIRIEADALRAIGATSELDLLRQGLLIHQKNQNGEATPDEIQFFESLDEAFQTTQAIEEKKLEYILQNQQQILSNLGSCSKD
jgi:hypothetical protein